MQHVVLVGCAYCDDSKKEPRDDAHPNIERVVRERKVGGVHVESQHHEEKRSSVDAVAKDVLFGRVLAARADGREPRLHVTLSHGDDVAGDDGAHQHYCSEVDEAIGGELS